jgi:hypothetical protein
MEEFFTIEKGCFICENEIRGNAYRGYYCKRCNLMFEKTHLERKLFPNEYETNGFF